MIGVSDLGAAALAMYVLLSSGMNVGLFRLTAVFIAAMLRLECRLLVHMRSCRTEGAGSL
jgi:hypothetical protein